MIPFVVIDDVGLDLSLLIICYYFFNKCVMQICQVL